MVSREGQSELRGNEKSAAECFLDLRLAGGLFYGKKIALCVRECNVNEIGSVSTDERGPEMWYEHRVPRTNAGNY